MMSTRIGSLFDISNLPADITEIVENFDKIIQNIRPLNSRQMQQLPEKPVAAMKELKPRAKSIWLRPIFYAAASVCAIVISATIWFAMPSEQSATTQVQAQKVLQQDEADTYIGSKYV